MKRFRKLLLSAAAVSALLTASASAWACSPESIRSPHALILLADGIYHVRAVSQSAPSEPNKNDRPMPWPAERVEFAVLGVLKGAPQATIKVAARLTPDDDWNDRPVPYDFVRLGGRGGNCYAVTFKSGAEYLLFLRNGTPHWSPLAPTSEQVTGPDDPWLTWVKEQVRSTTEQPNQSFKPTPSARLN